MSPNSWLRGFGPSRRSPRVLRGPTWPAAPAAEVLEERTLPTAYVVDTLSDVEAADGRLSLPEAVRAASTNAAVNEAAAGQGGGVADVITFAPSIAGGTITVRSRELAVTDALMISGPMTISGNGDARVFNIAAGADVTLYGLTITGGGVVGNGGGILNAGRLTLAESIVTGNRASFLEGQPYSLKGMGGGVYNSGVLTVSRSAITANAAAFGGGIADETYAGVPSLTVADSVVSGNTAGGGVWSVGRAVVRGSIVAGNVGAGIRQRFGSLEVTDSAVTDNAGAGVWGSGARRVGVLRCVVRANAGNGVEIDGTGTGLDFDGASLPAGWITGSAISGNGGAGVNFFQAAVTVEDSAMWGNRLGIGGRGTLKVSNSTVSGNRNNDGGAGVVLTYGLATLRNVTIFGNRADADGDGSPGGGGITATGGGGFAFEAYVRLENTIVAGNVRGAGAAATPSDVVVLSAESAILGTHNLIGGPSGGLTNGTDGNQTGVDWRVVLDPALRNNGGFTPTHALLAGSPATDAGSIPQALDATGGKARTDQRGPGFARVRGASVDIGASEAAFGEAARDDLIGFTRGEWYVGRSTTFDVGEGFVTTRWAAWADVAWDAVAQGDFNGDGMQDALGLIDGAWYVGLSTGSGYVTSLWGKWNNVAWGHVLTGDFDGDGKDDLLAEVGGDWWGSISTGSGFTGMVFRRTTGAPDFAALADVTGPTYLPDGKADLVVMKDGHWQVFAPRDGLSGMFNARGTRNADFADWADADYRLLGVGRFHVTPNVDFVGFARGEWYVALSEGDATTTKLRARWADVAWEDPVVGDFNGDGLDDVAARYQGQWWVGLTGPGGTEAARSSRQWSDVEWRGTVVGDFTGDGRDDVAAAALVRGETGIDWFWGTAPGTDTGFGLGGPNARWRAADWRTFAGEATGPTAAGGSGDQAAASQPPAARTAAPVAPVKAEEPLVLFWAQSDKDENFTGGLLAAG